jgi:hypothetical protein
MPEVSHVAFLPYLVTHQCRVTGCRRICNLPVILMAYILHKIICSTDVNWALTYKAPCEAKLKLLLLLKDSME